jgi:hypothetical protein
MNAGAAAAEGRRRSRTDRALLIGSVVLAAAASVPLLVSELPWSESHARAAPAFPLVSPAGLVERSGVRVVRVAVSGDGGLVDLRYRVLDSERAEAVHNPATPALLIDERTGGVINRPLMGHIHSGRPKVGLTYYLIYENPGHLLRRGERVTVQLGNARLAHVRVR